MELAVLGAGYVGLVTATGLATLGHRVRVYDIDRIRLDAVRKASPTLDEPGLAEPLRTAVGDGSLAAADSVAAAVRQADGVFVCVGTPAAAETLDLSAWLSCVRDAAAAARPGAVIVLRSTITPDALRLLPRDGNVRYAVNPETFRQGTAWADFLRPARLVFGAECAEGERFLRRVYAGIDAGVPRVRMRMEDATIAKLAANMMLATRISSANLIAQWCDAVGADVDVVLEAVGLDPRIGRGYLQPGLGFGGSCLVKDTTAVASALAALGAPAALPQGVLEINRRQVEWVADAIGARVPAPATVALWGLAFKPGTDDTRDSQAVALARLLTARGYQLRVHDPKADASRHACLDETAACGSVREAATGADAVVVATAWPEYVDACLAPVAALMRGRWLFDARNCMDPAGVRAAGLQYWGVARR